MSLTKAAAAPDALLLSLQDALAGRYSLDRELGRGGMGVVFLAREVSLDRLVAIKLLPPVLASNPVTRERFLTEASTAARLAHPHIIPIHAVDVVQDHVFYVMGFVDGESLAQRVARRGALPTRECARLMREIAWALAHAHAQGIVHRDIKPDNILIEHQSGRAIVADFGIAAAIGRHTDEVIGTPAFMSPDQLRGDPLDARSDLYALGATAFFALAGRPPFDGPDLTILARHLSEPAPSLASVGLAVPTYLVQLVARCLAKAPADRPRDAHHVASLLEKGLAGQRELPAALRAFVRRDGRADGLGTIVVVIAASAVGMVAAIVTGVFGYLAVLCVAWSLAALGFLVSAARQLLRAGFAHADVTATFTAEIDRLQEEHPRKPRRWLARLGQAVGVVIRTSLGAAAVVVIAVSTGASAVEAQSAVQLLPLLLVLPVLTSLLWAVASRVHWDDVLVWRWVWCGPLGRRCFSLARRLGGVPLTPGTMTHRATELSLSLAAEQLFEALAPEVRASLQAVPPALVQLQQGAAAMRQRCARLDELLVSAIADESAVTLRAERDRATARLEEAVGALERIRLDLLRLHAGTTQLEAVTIHVAHAAEIARKVTRLLAAHRAVENLFGRVHVVSPSRDTKASSDPNPAWA